MSWNDLSMKDRASYIKLGIENGITDLDTIRGIYNKFVIGGPIEKNNDNVSDDIAAALSASIMQSLRTLGANRKEGPTTSENVEINNGLIHPSGIAQDTYSLPRSVQERIFRKRGYTLDKGKDRYGTIANREDLDKRDIPVYVKGLVAENLTPISDAVSINGYDYPDSKINYLGWKGKKEDQLIHTGTYTSRYYVDPKTHQVYQRGWDLNDYGGTVGLLADYGRNKYGDIIYDEQGFTIPDVTKFQEPIITDVSKPAEAVAKRNQKALGGNLFADGGKKATRYRSSSNIRKQISTWEGSTMRTNVPFDRMDTMFNQVLPEGALEKLSQEQLDGLYSFAYNVGTGRFKTRTVPTLAKYLQGNATIEDVKGTMWASGDKKYRGLANRRKKERSMLGAYVPVQETIPMTTPLATPLDITPAVQPIIESNPVIQDNIETLPLAFNTESQKESYYTPGFFDYVNYINQIRQPKQPKQRDRRIWLTI